MLLELNVLNTVLTQQSMRGNMRIIAGPCQHESLEQSLEIAQECKRVCDEHEIDYYFKASFDKANRSSINGIRGVGIDRTMVDFIAIKEQLGVKLLTDVHTEGHVSRVRSVVDVIQIPAFLCRQTDLIRAACATDCIVNIKKGQFLAPWDVESMLSKTEGAKEVWITERGTSFDIILLLLTLLGWTTCLVIIILLWFLMPHTQYRSQVATEAVAAAIAITFLAYVVQVVLWVLEISF